MSSPIEALRQFSTWKSRVGGYINFLWDYQLPLCHPAGYWRQWGVDREKIHFASRRMPNRNRCYSILSKESRKPNVTLSEALHLSLWDNFRSPRRRDWCASVTYALWELFPNETEETENEGDREDPTCQATIDQFIFLGPFDWLYRELACVDYCHTVLGIPRNSGMYDALESLLQCGSLVFTFRDLCIICDRPTSFEPQIVFSDGATFA